jgi:putative Mn2+ efflux pump MntP
MFEGEKTWVFWVGLVMLTLAFLGLFQMVWSWTAYSYYHYSEYWKSMVPIIVGAITFILVGLYMMKSGVKKEQSKIQPISSNYKG